MKKLNLMILAMTLIGSQTSFADVPTGVLNCVQEYEEYEIAIKPVRLDFNYLLGDISQYDERTLSWSATECEDSTELVVDANEFAELMDGTSKLVAGHLKHYSPGIEVNVEVVCTLE